jgi:hypothetical protein
MLDQDTNPNDNYKFKFFLLISFVIHCVFFIIIKYDIISFDQSSKKNIPPISVEVIPRKINDIDNVANKKFQYEEEIVNADSKKVVKKQEEFIKEAPKQEPEAIEKKEITHIKKNKIKKDKNPKEDLKNSKKLKSKQSDFNKKISKKYKEEILKTIEKKSDGSNEKGFSRSISKKSDDDQNSSGTYNENMELSISEITIIQNQIEEKWNIPAGVENAEKIVVELYLLLGEDGSVYDVKLVDMACSSNANVCRAVGDSAIRAVWQASPIANLFPGRYQAWKEMRLKFTPTFN